MKILSWQGTDWLQVKFRDVLKSSVANEISEHSYIGWYYAYLNEYDAFIYLRSLGKNLNDVPYEFRKVRTTSKTPWPKKNKGSPALEE